MPPMNDPDKQRVASLKSYHKRKAARSPEEQKAYAAAQKQRNRKHLAKKRLEAKKPEPEDAPRPTITKVGRGTVQSKRMMAAVRAELGIDPIEARDTLVDSMFGRGSYNDSPTTRGSYDEDWDGEL